MKKFNLLMAAMMLFAVSFVACNNDDVDNGGNSKPDVPGVTEEVTFVISDLKASLTDVTYTVTPSNDEAEYLVFICEANAVEMCDFDAEIIDMLYTEIEEYAAANNTTLNDYLATKVKKGKLENTKVTNLAYGTNYYVLAFAVDSADNFEATSAIEMERFATTKPEQSACTFTIKATPYLTNVALKVTPSVNSQLWHLINVPVTEYQTYTSADGEYGWTKDQYFQNYLSTEIETLRGQGLTDEQISNKLFHTGVRTLSDSGLEAKTKYVSFAGAVSFTEGNAMLTSTLTELRYNTGEAAESDLTFDIDVYNVDHYSAEIKITPSDLDADYYYYIGYINSPKRDMKPIDIANAAVTEYIYYWENYTELKHLDPVKGVVDLTGENKFELNLAETEYFIVAFSFEPNPTYGTVIDEENGTYDSNPGTITSAPVYVSFKTAEHGDPTNAEFQFVTSEVGPYDFTLEVLTNDSTVYYQPGVAFASNFSEAAAISASAGSLAQIMQMCMEGQNPCLTYQEALEKLQESGYSYRNGDANFYIANLTPETEFIAYVLAIDIKTGTFVKCYYSDVIKTSAAGTVDPEIEVLGIWNGDDENGTIFGDADRTVGCPIVAVKYNNIENASALYTAYTTDAYNDVQNLSDQDIIASFRNYWNPVESLTVPYYFFIAEWDVERTILAYAQDANGAEGKVARLGVTPNSYREDIDALRALVEECNNATPKALSKSLVVANDEPTMECTWSEAVGAPRSAEVTYHEVEPLTVASDLVRVKVVKRFHF